MRLAAIYIKKHFLFSEPQTINLGGKYFYTITARESIDNEYDVTREENPNFIEGFWGENISLVSALVGENGAGKTSVLKDFDIYNFGIYKNNIHIWEKEDDSLIICFYQFQPKVSNPKMFLENKQCKYIFHEDSNIIQIHYSPIFEYDLTLLKDENRLGHIYSKNKKIVNLRFTNRLSTSDIRSYIYNNYFYELEFCEKFNQFSEQFSFLNYNLRFDFVENFWGEKKLWFDYKTKRNFNQKHFNILEKQYSYDEKKEIEIYWKLYYQILNSSLLLHDLLVMYILYINKYIKNFARVIIKELRDEQVEAMSIVNLVKEKLNLINDEKKDLANKLIKLFNLLIENNKGYLPFTSLYDRNIAIEIIKLQNEISLSIEDGRYLWGTYLFNVRPNRVLSSGEKSMINLFSTIYKSFSDRTIDVLRKQDPEEKYINTTKSIKNIILLLD
ncbi:hypothetical protein [Chryseobacterium mucoviscidosis]|uniref:ATP-binding protein n=1 Tax=Chryseobacterium mucoviscidosis TaxID=1945581 RepID=A0A202BYN7_9FLAO|nr:hypothetical protein [Chryseobacterium mucoviscidosis]OVE56598.1 hypothetical protein B0E34_13820 [Chryseobacterium mucoviscidosis]